MRLSFKYRLYPTRKQIEALEHQLREACDLYNCALEERIGAWKSCRKSLNVYDQTGQLRELRRLGLIGISNFGCSQDVLRRLDTTFKAFYRRISGTGKVGFPRFKSSRRYDSLTFQKYGNGCRLFDRTLRIQGVGQIKIKLHRVGEGNIKTVCIKREAGRWFAIFSVEREFTPLPASDKAVGIDVGLSAFATLSDGSEIDNPRHYRNAQRALRIAQRKVARRKKGSNRRRKAVAILARRSMHVRNQRANFHHQVSSSIVNEYGMIAVEDLNVKGLAGGMLAKSVHDAGWGLFLSKLSYKAANAGRTFVKVNPRGTSQTCICGASVAKKLRDRWHDCPECGLSAGRDHVSAQVILQRARTEPSCANVGVVKPALHEKPSRNRRSGHEKNGWATQQAKD